MDSSHPEDGCEEQWQTWALFLVPRLLRSNPTDPWQVSRCSSKPPQRFMATRIRGFPSFGAQSLPWRASPLSTHPDDGEAVQSNSYGAWRGTGKPLSAVETSEQIVAAVAATHRAAVERLFALGRVVIAVMQAAVLTLPSGPKHFEVAHVLAHAFALYAALQLVMVWRRPKLEQKTCEFLHTGDLVWASAISALSGGVSSHYYPVFVLVLISAGYRWGLRRAVMDAGIIVGVATTESLMSYWGLTPWAFEGDMFLTRVGYIVVLAFLFGILAEGQLALRFQALAVGGIMARVSQDTLVVPVVRAFLAEALDVFQARRVVLAVQERDAGSPVLWESTRSAAGGDNTFSRRHLTPAEWEAWFHVLPADVASYEAECKNGSDPRRSPLVLTRAGERFTGAVAVPSALGGGLRWRTVMAARVDASEHWKARVYVFDPALRPGGYVRLAFLQNVAAQVGPSFLNVFLMRKLRTSAASAERGRLARELHDGAVQTLLGLELRLEVLRRRAGADGELASELSQLQDIVRAGTMDVRALIELLTPVTLEPKELGVALHDLVQRFGRTNHIETAFEWAGADTELSPRQSHDAYRLAQEALVNVRRHSGATRVHVRFEADPGGALLIVEDDGKGLGFVGRMSHDQLAAGHMGPRVLRERVEGMGGRLVAESSDAGARLELSFPLYAPE